MIQVPALRNHFTEILLLGIPMAGGGGGVEGGHLVDGTKLP